MTQSTQSTSLLRQRMIEDMTMRKLAPKTQALFLRKVFPVSNIRQAQERHRVFRNETKFFPTAQALFTECFISFVVPAFIFV